jgi:hypothetical protein
MINQGVLINIRVTFALNGRFLVPVGDLYISVCKLKEKKSYNILGPTAEASCLIPLWIRFYTGLEGLLYSNKRSQV